MKKLVSIVVPAYNVETEIEDCIRSVQQQTYPEWELLVVNDGSKDSTAAIVEKVAAEDSRIHLFNQQNAGVSSARNTGIREASGIYIAFLDGDDMWEPEFLEEMIAAKEKYHVPMVYCGYSHLYTGGIRRKFTYPYVNGHILHDVINKKTQIHIGAILVDKSVIDQHNLSFTEGCLVAQDQEFVKKLVSLVAVRAVPRELMIYRIRTGSAIRAKWDWKKHIHGVYAFRRSAKFILSQSLIHYDKQQLARDLAVREAFNLYKLLWRMIKNGYEQEALELMNDEENVRSLEKLEVDRVKFIHRLKCSAVKSRNKFLWWLLRYV